MAKRRDSTYECGVRRPEWVKLPHRSLTEVVVVGWVRSSPAGRCLARGGRCRRSRPRNGRQRDDGADVGCPAGRARSRRRARSRPRPVRRGGAPSCIALAIDWPGSTRCWSPRCATSVTRSAGAFGSRSWSGCARTCRRRTCPGFRGERPGVDPVTQVAGRRLRLTNLDKVLYPASATTKAELFGYILAVSEPLLAQLALRPITRRRWPDGVDQPDFYEKSVRPGTP